MTGIMCALLGSIAGAPTVAIGNETVSDLGANNPAIAGYSLTSAGLINVIPAGTSVPAGAWISPQTGMSGYDVNVTGTGSGGTLTGSATGVGVWLNLGTTRTWTLSSGTPFLFCDRVLTVQIRDAVTLTVLTSATITLQVEAN